MSALLLPLLIALLVAMLLGQSLTARAREPVRWWPLVPLAIVADLVLARIPVTQVPWLVENGHWLWSGTLVLIAAVLLRNTTSSRGWSRAPWAVALLGAALNLVVIFANGGYMPVDANAFESTGGAAEVADRPRYRRDVPVTAETRMPFLADVLLPPVWLPNRSVISLGDVILVVGLSAWLLGSALTDRPRRRVARAPATA